MILDTVQPWFLLNWEVLSTCVCPLQSQGLAPLCKANLHSFCTAECELVLLLSARNMCAQMSTQQVCCAIITSPPSIKPNSTQNFVCLSSPMHRLWSSRRLCGVTSFEQWNDIRYSHDGRGPFCMYGFCCVVCLPIFRKWEGVVGTGWGWLRIGTGGGRLWVR